MLCRHSPSRRSSLSSQLLRHFSIRVSSRKKQSLLTQLLRGNGSPKLSKPTQKGADPCGDGAKAIPLSQRAGASSRSVYPYPPRGLFAELPALENGRRKDQRLVEADACSDRMAKCSVRSKKESKVVQPRDAVTELPVLSPEEAHHFEGGIELHVPSQLCEPSAREGRKPHHSVDGMQPSVRALTGSERGQASYGDRKHFQAERMKIDQAKFSVQPQIAGEEGHHSHGPVEVRAGGKSLDLQMRGTSQNPHYPAHNLVISPLRTGPSEESSSLDSQVGDEPGNCTTGGKVFSIERDEEDEVQNAIKHTLVLLTSAVRRESSKRLDVEKLVEVHFEILRQAIADKFLNNLQQKLELVSMNSALPTHVKALLMSREFLSASSKKLEEVFTILKLFFESGSKAWEILAGNAGIIEQPLGLLEQRLKVLVEFEIDKETCYKIGTTSCMMAIEAEKLRRVLGFLKDLGLRAESRNMMLYKVPHMINYSVENHLQPIVDLLEGKEIARPTLLKLFKLYPETLCMSLDEDFTFLCALTQHVGFSSMDCTTTLRKLQFMCTDIPWRYNFFKEQGFSDEAFFSMIKKNPLILCMPVQDLEAKLHFLLHKAKWDISKLVAYPTYFNYSLARRIVPRFELLERLSLPWRPRLSTLLISKRFDITTV